MKSVALVGATPVRSAQPFRASLCRRRQSPARATRFIGRLTTGLAKAADRNAAVRQKAGLSFLARCLAEESKVPKQFPWKKSHRKVPPSIAAELARITPTLVVVAATKKIPVRDIVEGLYDHLGLPFDGADLSVVPGIVPSGKVGRYSDRNVNGWVVKRTDLPKITKTFSWETPNFGDASTYGTHTHYQAREVYQQQVFEPRHFPIKVEILNSPGGDFALVKFEVGQTLDRSTPGFEDEFLFCLNLLQENTGIAGVFSSTATRDDFIGTVHLDWEVFPPGNAAQLIASITKGQGIAAGGRVGVVDARLKLFAKLPVEKLIKGTNSFGSYIGALYADNLVVFENMNYGNALYVLYDNWQDISKRSRLELLRGTTKAFDRFVHTDGWEDRFLEHIRGELKKRGRSATPLR
jgi:hypothetical protein